MNGMLHLGHAFSLSKLEFAAAFHRLCGKNVLFPQGFHTTGMPIKACADKLARELATYGCPPQFPTDDAEEEEISNGLSTTTAATEVDPTKFKATKSKAVAKKGLGATQWDILKSSGIAEEEIPAFADPAHWQRYFPPLAQRDITSMGCGVDWRRSFVTTDLNPYYDSFVGWQFETLRAAGKIVKDKRYAVFSPLDGQPCADHDRATGEGVGPQEYTLVKMKVAELRGPLSSLEAFTGGVYLLAATLRPETMYGQTNAWALPDGDYGAFRGLNDEVYVLTDRAALNLSYQDRMPETGRPEKLLHLKGHDLLGLPIESPRAPHKHIYVLPLLTILTNKGTGIVTSVPSDAPDDYAALMDLKNKPKLREKFNIIDEWVLPFEIVPIIDIPGFGSAAAAKVCEDMKIQSQNDTKKLAEAKQLVYLKGFTDGVLIVGPHAGRKVSEVKAVIKEEMIAGGEAIVYSEPERPVMSRSGDECVVALTDQWYITYGEQEWKEATLGCLAKMEVYDESARHSFEHTLGWLNQWACSRSFGLGTRLPWDPVYLIESLSDSTIYMAYYTIAHILQRGNIYGEDAEAPIRPEDMTRAVFDYIFLDGPPPSDSGISPDLLEVMKREFEYWYPFDLRVSGKDLIQNHLTFALYNHTAIWAHKPENWPVSMRANGHLLLNSEKMSKSTGNFKTLQQAIQEYSSDAMRVALADAGDAMDDANFEHATANGAILRLTKEVAWAEEALAAVDSMRDEAVPSSFIDRVFDNAMNVAVHVAHAAYNEMLFREALKVGWYDLLNARDTYRFACGPAGMNQTLVLRFLEVSSRLLAPIAPHTCEHVWSSLLKKSSLIVNAGWPEAAEPDATLVNASKYVEELIAGWRKLIGRAEQAKKGAAAPPKIVRGDVYVVDRYGGWQGRLLEILAAIYKDNKDSIPGDAMKQILAHIHGQAEFAHLNQKAIKGQVMPFAKKIIDSINDSGTGDSLEPRLPFDEANLIEEAKEYVLRSLGIQELQVHRLTYEEQQTNEQAKSAVPGSPGVYYS